MMNIIALVNDETLRQRIKASSTKLDDDVEWVWSVPVKGAVARVAELRPVLLLVDLRDDNTDWADIVFALKSNPATRRLAILGFAKDLDAALRERAHDLLVDEVFDIQDTPKGKVLQTLPDRMRVYARSSDADLQAAIADAAQEPMPALVKVGLDAFNAGEFYDAHEYLETAWMQEAGEVRNVYRGILQIAVAYYHIQAQNYRGALKMFLRALQWLEPLPDHVHRINIAKLRQDARKARQAMEALGADGLAGYDLALLQPVEFDPAFVTKDEA